jgi:hypothetical protein
MSDTDYRGANTLNEVARAIRYLGDKIVEAAKIMKEEKENYATEEKSE